VLVLHLIGHRDRFQLTLMTSQRQDGMKIFNPMEDCVVVIGPAILDRYIECDVFRLDQTSPVPIGRVRSQRDCAGGAGNVVANLSAMGVPVVFLSLVGEDPDGKASRALYMMPGVEALIRESPLYQTVVKTRLVDKRGQIFCRFDVEEDAADMPELVTRTMLQGLQHIKERYRPRVIVLSDYDKGVVTPEVIRETIEYSHACNIPVIVDPVPAHTQHYRGATILAPNEWEALEMAGLDAGVPRAAAELYDHLGYQAMVVTAGANGLHVYTGSGMMTELPAVGTDVVDTTGAGDTVVAGLAAGLYFGMPILDAAAYARDASSVAVHKPRTSTASHHEIFKLQTAQRPEAKVVLLDDLMLTLASVQRSGGRIAVANGVFDLAHRGHHVLFDGAAKKCDFLVALVNADASAERAKGQAPVQDEHMRADMVSRIPSVDAVVVFTEDTPTPMIKSIRPHVLVKGCDYTPDKVVGGELVASWGGEVVIIPDDRDSTTDIVDRVLDRQAGEGL
jgi:D-beta-D-heptose 7-phosphate kinase/D-beta-D-heptose 1-phosphate adenosyltransferase